MTRLQAITPEPAEPLKAPVCTPGAMALLICVAGLFLLIVLPVVARGAPLRDDFDVCLSPRWTSGPGRMLSELWPELGAVRLLGRFIELSLIAGLCHAVPFGAIILIPLLVTCAVAYMLRKLLYDLGIATPWPEIGAALWFLQPLGTEAALWPAALHIPLALVLALAGLRLYVRGRLLPAALLGLAGSWSLEQVLFALPVAVWVGQHAGAPPAARNALEWDCRDRVVRHLLRLARAEYRYRPFR